MQAGLRAWTPTLYPVHPSPGPLPHPQLSHLNIVNSKPSSTHSPVQPLHNKEYPATPSPHVQLEGGAAFPDCDQSLFPSHPAVSPSGDASVMPSTIPTALSCLQK